MSPSRLLTILAGTVLLACGPACAQQNTTYRYEYDANGNRTRIIDPLNHVTLQQYDALNRLVRATDPNNGVTQYGYNALDQLTQVTDPRNLVTRYTLDGLGNQTALNSPDTGNTGHIFDAAGNLVTRTDAKGQTTTYRYDALNRVTRISHADGNVIGYQYDQGANGIGRLSRITDATGSTQYGYGPHGRVTSEVRTIGNQAHTTGYRYDNIGRLSGMTYPTGRSIDYTRDSLGRISRIDTSKDGVTQPIVTQVRYQPFGPANTVTYGNGQSYRRSYDLDSRITSYTLNGQAQTISYDAASRITAIDGPSTPNGINVVNSNYTYGTTSNRLTQITGNQAAAIVTDPNGNITGKGANQFSYDARNRMVSATTSGGTVQYRINGLGQRVQKITPTQSTVFHYDQGGKLIAETSGQTGIDYVYLDDMPVAMGDGAARVYYIHSDHLNSPRMITDQNNNVVWEWQNIEPFGNNLPNDNPSGLGVFKFDLRFAGMRADEETGTFYNYFRDHYFPDLGRYGQSDPIGLAGGINTYLYANAAPTIFTDPLGLVSMSEVLTQISAVGPFDANTAGKIADQSLAAAKKSGLGGLHNGPADAYRHCVWSCEMTKSIGAKQAKKVGDIHEKYGENPAGEICMDLHNNAQGRGVAGGASCSASCLGLLKGGNLQTSPGGTSPSELY